MNPSGFIDTPASILLDAISRNGQRVQASVLSHLSRLRDAQHFEIAACGLWIASDLRLGVTKEPILFVTYGMNTQNVFDLDDELSALALGQAEDCVDSAHDTRFSVEHPIHMMFCRSGRKEARPGAIIRWAGPIECVVASVGLENGEQEDALSRAFWDRLETYAPKRTGGVAKTFHGGSSGGQGSDTG